MLSFNSQLTYVSLIWMFAGKRSTAKICKIHFKWFLIVMKNHIITCWISVMFLPLPPPPPWGTYVSQQLKSINHLWISILSSCGNFSIKIQSSVIYEKEIKFTSHLPDPPVTELIPYISVEVYSGTAFPVMKKKVMILKNSNQK